MYDFTLDRKGMISVLASTVLMGGLLFVAGLIMGSYWTANMSTASAASRQRANAADLNSLPQEPVRMNELPQSTLTTMDGLILLRWEKERMAAKRGCCEILVRETGTTRPRTRSWMQ